MAASRGLAPVDLAVTAWRDLALAPGLFARLAAPPFAWAAAVAAVLPGLADAVPELLLLLLGPALEAAKLLLLMPTASAWHRFVVLGPDHPQARLRYTVGREEWAYLRQSAGLLLMLMLVGAASGVLLALGAFLTGHLDTIADPDFSRRIIQPAVVLLALALVAPRFLGLPAAAAGRPIPRETLRAATRRAHLPLVVALLIAYAPYAVAERVAGALLAATPLATTLAVEALKLIAVGASLGVLSHAHRRLFGDRAVAPAADA